LAFNSVPDEPVVFPPKKVPTKLKHWVLERCLSAWGGIIINSNAGEIRLCFIDTCSGSGLYQSADSTDTTEGKYEVGSALIGPQALAELREYAIRRTRRVKTRALLINADPRELHTAEDVITASGLASSLDEIRYEPRRLADAQQIVSRFMHNWFSFVFIDPYGPSPTPFSVVSDIVGGRYTDTLINFPYYSFHKWTGFLGKPQTEEGRLEAADAFMGGPEWRALALAAKRTGRALDEVLVDHYMDRLVRIGVHALALPLMFEDRDRVMYHLVFTSHNVAGLSSAKQRFLEGQSHQVELRQDAEVQRTGQGFLFRPPEAQRPQVNIDALAAELSRRFSGRTLSMERVVLAGLRLANVLEADIRKALTRMKRAGSARYSDQLRYEDQIVFAGSEPRANG
jgi:three-Cys-motif partner protein